MLPCWLELELCVMWWWFLTSIADLATVVKRQAMHMQLFGASRIFYFSLLVQNDIRAFKNQWRQNFCGGRAAVWELAVGLGRHCGAVVFIERSFRPIRIVLIPPFGWEFLIIPPAQSFAAGSQSKQFINEPHTHKLTSRKSKMRFFAATLLAALAVASGAEQVRFVDRLRQPYLLDERKLGHSVEIPAGTQETEREYDPNISCNYSSTRSPPPSGRTLVFVPPSAADISSLKLLCCVDDVDFASSTTRVIFHMRGIHPTYMALLER